MKTMKDFKGTQGEFFDEYPFVNSDALMVRTKDGYVCEVKAPDTHTKQEAYANAKLFVNSKKVLEALIIMVEANKRMAQWIVNADNSNKAFTGMEAHAIAIEAINNSL